MTRMTAKPEDLSPMERMALIRQGEALVARGQKSAELHYELGIVYKAESQIGEAIRHLLAANKLKKKDPQIIGHLADAYVRTKDMVSARKFVRKMVELQPREEEILVYQADFLEKCGQYTQALAVWEKVHKLFPESTQALVGLAGCLRILGRWDEAETAYRKTLALDPTHAQTLYYIANSRKFSGGEAEELLSAIRESLSDLTDEIMIANLHYAAGKLNSELGSLDVAMEHYHKANDQRGNDDRDPFNAFRNIPVAFTKEVIRRQGLNGSPSEAPIFVLGMPRSGTTLVESLLGGHSGITSGGELGTMGTFASRLGVAKADPQALRKLTENWSGEDIGRFAREYLDVHGELMEKTPYFTDKMPHNFQHLGLIRMLFPNAKIIHCRRHPVDNCLSIYTNSMSEFHNAYKSDLKKLGLYYRQYLQLMEHWRRELPGGFHEVFYEDVVANTELNARGLIDYLDLQWEDSVMDRKDSQKGVRTLSVWQVRQPVYTSSAGRWKKYEPYLGPLIDALGGSIAAYEAELAGLAAGEPA